MVKVRSQDTHLHGLMLMSLATYRSKSSTMGRTTGS